MPASASSGWSSRRVTPPPLATSEIITLSTVSGVSLAVEVRDPPRARSTAILLHPSMASRRIWSSSRDRSSDEGASGGAGFSSVLAEHGVRTLALDFRGHGESGISAARGGVWNFDDLAREDLPALCRAARERWPRDRLTLVGHSLGGQVAMASVATGLADADAIATLATNVWLPSEEPNPVLRAQKSAVVKVMRTLARARGYLPARALALGSDDESAAYTEGWTANWERDRWQSDDLAVDYFDVMSKIAVPVLAVTSLADRFLCTPQAAFRFATRATRATVRFELIRRADDGGDAPSHMGIVTTGRAVSRWHETAEFCLG